MQTLGNVVEVTTYKPQIACIMPCGCAILYGRRFEDGALIEGLRTCLECRSVELRAQYVEFLSMSKESGDEQKSS